MAVGRAVPKYTPRREDELAHWAVPIINEGTKDEQQRRAGSAVVLRWLGLRTGGWGTARRERSEKHAATFLAAYASPIIDPLPTSSPHLIVPARLSISKTTTARFTAPACQNAGAA